MIDQWAIYQHLGETPGEQLQASRLGLRVSSANSVRVELYPVPPDYDADVAVYPYKA